MEPTSTTAKTPHSNWVRATKALEMSEWVDGGEGGCDSSHIFPIQAGKVNGSIGCVSITCLCLPGLAQY